MDTCIAYKSKNVSPDSNVADESVKKNKITILVLNIM